MSQDRPRPAPINTPSSRLRRWRTIQGFAGLSLAATIFMPAATSCRTTIIPVVVAYESFSRPTRNLADATVAFFVYVAPYLFGLLTSIAAVRRWKHVDRTEGVSEWSIAILFALTIVIFLGSLLWELLSDGWSSPMPAFAAFGLFSAGHWSLTIGRGMGGRFCLRWWASVCCTVWFTFIYFFGVPLYGLYISCFGSAVIACGMFAEARMRCHLRRFETLMQLLTGRLRFYPPDEPRCMSCGYLLIGLPSDRCPECGTRNERASSGPASACN